MSIFLSDASAADSFRCEICGIVYPRIAIHEHHKVKQASGGSDSRTNIAFIDSNCHTALHQIETALRSESKRPLIPDLLQQMFPSNLKAQQTCLLFATTAALGRDPNQPATSSAIDRIDYSVFDTDELVHLTPPRVTPFVKHLISIVAREMKNPNTGKPLGVATYVRLLIEQDLRRRGLSLTPPPKFRKT